MSIEASTCVGFGRYFEDVAAAGDWFRANCKRTFTPDIFAALEEDFCDALEDLADDTLPTVTCSNYFTGKGAVLYFPFDTSSVTNLKQSIDAAVTKWDALFEARGDVFNKGVLS